MSVDSASFELILVGLRDEKPDTERKVKAALVTELHLSASQVQKILLNLPYVLMVHEDPIRLDTVSGPLEIAGAKVEVREHYPDEEEFEDYGDLSGGDYMGFELEFPTEESFDTSQKRRSTTYHVSLDDGDVALAEEQDSSNEASPVDSEEIEALLESLNQSKQVLRDSSEDPLSRLLSDNEDIHTQPDDSPSPAVVEPPKEENTPEKSVEEAKKPQPKVSTPAPAPKTPTKKEDPPAETVEPPAKKSPESEPAPEAADKKTVAKASADTQPKVVAPAAPPAEETAPTAVKVKKKFNLKLKLRKLKKSFGMLIGTAVVAVVLVAGTYIGVNYYQGNLEDTAIASLLDGILAKNALSKRNGLGIKSTPLKPELHDGTISIQEEKDGYTFEVEFFLKKGVLKDVTFYLTTPEPKAASDLDIIAKKVAPPHLRSLRFDNPKLEKRPEGKQLGSAPALAFISYNGKREREKATAVVQTSYSKKSQVLTAEILINKGFESLPEEDYRFTLDRKTGEYKIFLRANLKRSLGASEVEELEILEKGTKKRRRR